MAPRETEELLLERKGHVAVMTLNRPDRMNAISGPMLGAFTEWLNEYNRDPEVRVVILTGAGRGFCAGLDLQAQGQAMGTAPAGDGDGAERPAASLFDMHNSPPVALYRMDKPVICALNGAAAGYGMDLALLCDIRIAGESGRMAPVGPKRGVLPESGGAWLLPRMIGTARAAEVMLRARVLDAQESLALGLVNKVVPDDQLMTVTMEWAEEIAANAPLSIQATKRMMRLGEHETFETAVDHTMLELRTLFAMQDFKEGVSAFLERREPTFTGR